MEPEAGRWLEHDKEAMVVMALLGVGCGGGGGVCTMKPNIVRHPQWTHCRHDVANSISQETVHKFPQNSSDEGVSVGGRTERAQ